MDEKDERIEQLSRLIENHSADAMCVPRCRYSEMKIYFNQQWEESMHLSNVIGKKDTQINELQEIIAKLSRPWYVKLSDFFTGGE